MEQAPDQYLGPVLYMDFTQKELSIPNPVGAGGTVRSRFDLSNVMTAELRVSEIASVNAHKAPELLSVFALAMRDLSTHFAQLQYLSSVAARKKRERRAVVVLEIIPGKLAEKKVSNNDTNREAVIELDPEYAALCDVEAEVEAAYVYVREKARNMESHLNAVKKILDSATGFTPSTWVVPNTIPNSQVGYYDDNPERTAATPPPQITTTTTNPRFKIGKANYGS
jgi:hypothetical protein